jgi:hypothetical protein
MVINLIQEYKRRTEAFETEAHSILAQHESSKSRIISVDETRKKLTDLSLDQDELLKQALTCVERGIYRAAHVMAWSAFIDYLQRKLASDGLVKVKSEKPGWDKYKTIEELRENIADYQLIEVACDVGLITKSETKSIKGLLSKRNECAHPSVHNPGLNESLGYIDEILSRIKNLQQKTL